MELAPGKPHNNEPWTVAVAWARPWHRPVRRRLSVAGPRRIVPARGLTHGDVMDFVTGGAAALANRRDAAHARPYQHATTSGDLSLKIRIRRDLHRRLKAEAARRRTTVGKVLELLVQRHLRD